MVKSPELLFCSFLFCCSYSIWFLFLFSKQQFNLFKPWDKLGGSAHSVPSIKIELHFLLGDKCQGQDIKKGYVITISGMKRRRAVDAFIDWFPQRSHYSRCLHLVFTSQRFDSSLTWLWMQNFCQIIYSAQIWPELIKLTQSKKLKPIYRTMCIRNLEIYPSRFKRVSKKINNYLAFLNFSVQPLYQ